MYKIQIGCNRRLSKIFYIDENAFNSYFGCSSADEFKRTARQEPYACKILSVDKSAEAFSLAFADRVLSRLYIAEYLVADYGSEHKALGIIRSEIKDCTAFDGYMDVIDFKSVENIDYAIKLYTDYITKIMNLVESDAEKYRRRKSLKSIIELARLKNSALYFLVTVRCKKGDKLNGNTA